MNRDIGEITEQDLKLYGRIDDYDLIDFLQCPNCGTEPLVGRVNADGHVCEGDGAACPACGGVYTVWVTDGHAEVGMPPEGTLCPELLKDLLRCAGLP